MCKRLRLAGVQRGGRDDNCTMFLRGRHQLVECIEGGPDAWNARTNIRWDATKPVTIYVQQHTRQRISREGNLVLGSLKDVSESTQIHLTIGGLDFGTVDLAPHAGAFVFAHANRFVVPLINIHYSEVCATPFDDPSISVVWGSIMGSEPRRAMHFSEVYSDIGNGMVAKYAGMAYIIPAPVKPRTPHPYPLPDIIKLPDMGGIVDDLLEGPKKRAITRCDTLRQELMVATWHPSRMCRWCLDHEECASLLDELGTPVNTQYS